MALTLSTLALFLPVIAATPTFRDSTSPGLIISEATHPRNITANVRTSSVCGGNRPGARVQHYRKKGVAYQDANTHWANMFTSVTWAYNWYSDEHFWTANSPGLKIDFIPMLHDLRFDEHVRDWDKNIWAAKNNRGRYEILGFNEPDKGWNEGGSAISPQDAANAWRQHMEPYACQGFRLGAPAISNSDRPGEGLQWLDKFLAFCNDCTIDFIPFHVYLPANNVQAWKDAIALARWYGRSRPLWLTEFQPKGNDDEADNLLRQLIPYMDNLDYLERYSYWLAKPGHELGGPLLIADNGNELSRIGRLYNDL